MYIWQNDQTGEQSLTRPIRIRLPDGYTRTNEAVTDELLALTGWRLIEVPDPVPEPEPIGNVALQTATVGENQ